MPTERSVTNIGIIGHGAIGSVVAAKLAGGQVPGAELAGVCTRKPITDSPAPWVSCGDLIESCDLIVEVAGHQAVQDHATEILDHGRDLLIVSTGALADPELRERIAAAGPGHLLLCPGALGGTDILEAVARASSTIEVRLTTTKQPGGLVRPWMDAQLRDRLKGGCERVVAFEGTAGEAALRFPASANVAATLALAVTSWEAVRVVVIGDPAAEMTRHAVEVRSAIGNYRFEVANMTSPQNPTTSMVVPYAVLACVTRYTRSESPIFC